MVIKISQILKMVVFPILIIVVFLPITILSQNSEINSSEKIDIYPKLSVESSTSSRYNLILDYYGKNKIFSNDEKSLALDAGGKEIVLKNGTTTSKIKYNLQTSTFSRIPDVVSAKGVYAITPNELKEIANAEYIKIVSVGVFNPYNRQLPNETIDKFSTFITSNDVQTISSISSGENKIADNNTEEEVIPPQPKKPDEKEIGKISSTNKIVLKDLGLNLSNLPETGKRLFKVKEGVLIKRVDKNSDAFYSGFSSGTVISHVNGRKVKSISFLKNFLENRKGKKVSFTVKTISGNTKFIWMSINK